MNSYPLAWHMGRYLEYRTVRLAQRSIESYRTDLRLLLRCLAITVEPDLPLSDIETVDAVANTITADVLTVDNLASALAHARAGAFRTRHPGQPRSDGSVRHVWACATAFCDRLVQRGILTGNPMGGVDNAAPPKTQPKALSPSVARELLAISSEEAPAGVRIRWPVRDYAIVATALLVGTRISEMTDLTVGGIHGVPGQLYLHVPGKGRHERPLPVPPRLEAALVDYLDERIAGVPAPSPGVPAKPPMRRGLPDGVPVWERIVGRAPLFVTTTGDQMNRNHLHRIIDHIYRQAGLPSESRGAGVAAHAMRHTFATMLSDAGTSTFELQQLMGHASSTTTERYVKTTASALRGAVLANPLAFDESGEGGAVTIEVSPADVPDLRKLAQGPGVVTPEARQAALDLIRNNPEVAAAVLALATAASAGQAGWPPHLSR